MFQWHINVFYFLALVVSIFSGETSGYNLDIKGNIVFSDPNRGNYGKASYFGYAVALYASASDPVVLVGAPRANVSRLSGIEEPGAVYYCHLNGTCKEWVLDKTKNGRVRQLKDVNQRLDDAWIGASISVENTTNPRIVVCAPKWKNVISKHYYLNGICYYTVAKSPRAFEQTVQSIINIFAGRNGQTSKDNQGKGFYLRGMAQLGFSLHEFSDEHDGHHFITGSPGFHESAGNSVLLSENERGEIESVVPEGVDGVGVSIIGYSVTSGFYFDSRRKDRWHVASAPRTRDVTGAVLIFKYDGNKSVKKLTTIRGTQIGEYFGASVTSCNIDNDGRDELIVGAPSWSKNEDEGRIYIISARKNSNGFDMTSIDGKFKGARFGSSVVCLGDLDHDGYGDVAVGAPYEDKSGAVYIFNGGRYGLSKEPSQKILGKDFGRLSGFGLAISEPRDVDGNGYPDVAIGAYRSGHAVLFRAQPVVKVNISLNYVDSARLNSNTTKFSVRFCGYYDGYRVPETLRVKRIFKVDEAHHRARLGTHSSSDGTYELDDVLHYGRETCSDIPIILMRETKTDPIDISALLILIDEAAIVNKERSKIEATVRLPFDVNCGSDNVCHANLTCEISTSLGTSNKYIIGGEKTVNVSIAVRNHGEPAYEAKVHVLLPEFLVLASVPSDCLEKTAINGSVEVVCDIGNPIRQQNSLKLELDMSQLRTESQLYADSIYVPISLSTQSINDNDQNGINHLIIHLIIDTALNITGQAKDNPYSYFSASEENKLDVIQFNHIYGAQKLGITPIQQAVFIVLVPTHLRKSKNEIIEIARINATTLKFFDSANRNDNDYVCKIERIGENEKKMIDKESNNITQPVDISLRNRALFLNCENVAIDCVNVTCLMDVPKESVNSSVIAELKLTIDLLLKNVTDDFTTMKDIIYFVSNGSVMITHPSRASETSEMRTNSTLVSTQFLGTPVAAQVTIWIIAVSVLVGILLLALLIFALIKLGFFKRKQKEQLEALKAGSDRNQGIVIETTSSKEVLDQD